MGRQCIFCANPANTLDHLWPDWILKSLKAAQPIRHTIGKKPPFYVNNPEVKIRAVCKQCNEGWMSQLEVLNKPLIGTLIHDISAPIDSGQQSNLAAWTIKTAMIVDAMNRQRPQFYSIDERISLRTQLSIPTRTTIWLGRHSGSSFHAGGTDVWLDKGEVSKVAQGCVTTVIIGHLAIQSISVHALRPEHFNEPFQNIAIKLGFWSQLLCSVWPPDGKQLGWPPPLTFTTRGRLSIAGLMDRWRTGTEI